MNHATTVLLTGVFIGEAAHSMVQNVDYEIPYLRKQAAKHNTVITDADRKVAEYERSAASCAASFKQVWLSTWHVLLPLTAASTRKFQHVLQYQCFRVLGWCHCYELPAVDVLTIDAMVMFCCLCLLHATCF